MLTKNLRDYTARSQSGASNWKSNALMNWLEEIVRAQIKS